MSLINSSRKSTVEGTTQCTAIRWSQRFWTQDFEIQIWICQVRPFASTATYLDMILASKSLMHCLDSECSVPPPCSPITIVSFVIQNVLKLPACFDSRIVARMVWVHLVGPLIGGSPWDTCLCLLSHHASLPRPPVFQPSLNLFWAQLRGDSLNFRSIPAEFRRCEIGKLNLQTLLVGEEWSK